MGLKPHVLTKLGLKQKSSDKEHYKILHTSSELSQDLNPECKC